MRQPLRHPHRSSAHEWFAPGHGVSAPLVERYVLSEGGIRQQAKLVQPCAHGLPLGLVEKRAPDCSPLAGGQDRDVFDPEMIHSHLCLDQPGEDAARVSKHDVVLADRRAIATFIGIGSRPITGTHFA